MGGARCWTLTCVCVCLQLMSKETPVTGGNDSYVDLDRQVHGQSLVLHSCVVVVSSVPEITTTFLIMVCLCF